MKEEKDKLIFLIIRLQLKKCLSHYQTFIVLSCLKVLYAFFETRKHVMINEP